MRLRLIFYHKLARSGSLIALKATDHAVASLGT